MTTLLQLVPEGRDADCLIEELEQLLEDVKAGKVDAVSFVAIRADDDIFMTSKTTKAVSMLRLLGSIKLLEAWYVRTQIEPGIFNG
jgi:hypothetical protein